MAQLGADLRHAAKSTFGSSGFQLGLSSMGHLRPDISFPAHLGLVPDDGFAPIMNLFDRTGGGKNFSYRVTRRTCRDFRGGRLTYDEHDGTDIVCPIHTPLCAAAPGTVVLIRDRWMRGGLTVAVDHGHGMITQYTHCSKALVPVGERVKRGQPVALSGTSGMDMTMFFPWVPPHVHFMVWINGRPVDPFLAPGEEPRPGTWLQGNAPEPSDPLASDAAEVALSPVDEARTNEVADTCTDPRIEREVASLRNRPASLAALLEDSLHHDRWAWPTAMQDRSIRPPANGSPPPAPTLPLPRSEYGGIRFADSRGTAP